jgi:predicted DNA-binding transcriptional regulator AlpA
MFLDDSNHKEQNTIMNTYIIRPNELAKRLNLSTVTIWRMEKSGQLPKRVQIGTRSVGWRTSDIEQWLSDLQPVTGELK